MYMYIEYFGLVSKNKKRRNLCCELFIYPFTTLKKKKYFLMQITARSDERIEEIMKRLIYRC